MSKISVIIINTNDRELTLKLYTYIEGGQTVYSEDIPLNKFKIQFSVERKDTRYQFMCMLKEDKECENNTLHHLVISTVPCCTISLISKCNTYTGIFDITTTNNSTVNEIKATLFSVPLNINSFKTLYDDNELLDFKISVKGSDQALEVQSVGFHRAVLAAWSPVMMKMLSNSWKEKDEGLLALPVNLYVIKAFKQYVYMNKLPSDRETLLGLVELGNYFMDPKLELAATQAIASITKPEEILETFSYSLQYQLHNLTASMLFKIKKADVEVLIKSLKKNVMKK